LYRGRIDPGLVDARSPVGSGDAFLAGYVASRYTGRAPNECLRFAVACGAESVQHFGAGVLDPGAAERLMSRVEVEVLSEQALSAHAASPCARWSDRTLASGLGSLENIEFDDLGGLLLSATAQNAIVRLGRDGKLKHLVDNVNNPGGMRVRGGVLFFNTGDALASGIFGTPDGTIDRLDLRTRR